MGLQECCILHREAVPQELVCPICHDVTLQPHQTKCSHIFCKACLARAKSSVCPVCQGEIGEDGTLDLVVKRIWEAIKVRCYRPNSLSCDWTGSISDLDAHIESHGSPKEKLVASLSDLVDDYERRLKDMEKERDTWAAKYHAAKSTLDGIDARHATLLFRERAQCESQLKEMRDRNANLKRQGTLTEKRYEKELTRVEESQKAMSVEVKELREKLAGYEKKRRSSGSKPNPKKSNTVTLSSSASTAATSTASSTTGSVANA